MLDNQVFIAKSPAPEYKTVDSFKYPELDGDFEITTSLIALRQLFIEANLDSNNLGKESWNPLGEIIEEDKKVLIKPNWVNDINKVNLLLPKTHPEIGIDCLVTHTSVIEAILVYLEKVNPKQVIVGDAPIQRCDFNNLLESSNFSEMISKFQNKFRSISVVDFRRTIKHGGLNDLNAKTSTDLRSEDMYVLYDLKESSQLEPITEKDSEFRVTVYNPDYMKRTHNKGKHQYLIAKEVIEADVIINVPKLKTHKKAGITCALKNMVGMNGNKEYLPHHRKGGSKTGGDNYKGGSILKRIGEDFLDAANRSSNQKISSFFFFFASLLVKINSYLLSADKNMDGAWYGNDTVWRMVLDLQTILHYGKVDASMSEKPVRKVITIVDGIIAGEGEGPLAPYPVPLGIMTMGLNTLAMEYVHALLMRLDPEKIPLIREAFSVTTYPLFTEKSSIKAYFDGKEISLDNISVKLGKNFIPPIGWKGNCELENIE